MVNRQWPWIYTSRFLSHFLPAQSLSFHRGWSQMGLFAELGAGVSRHPALPLLVTKLGGPVLCPTQTRGPFVAPKEPWCVCSLHTEGIHVPGRGPGSHPAQHAPSGDPKPFQKIPGIFPILKYEVGSPAWNYPVRRISLHISKAWNTEWKHVTHLPISFSPTCLL